MSDSRLNHSPDSQSKIENQNAAHENNRIADKDVLRLLAVELLRIEGVRLAFAQQLPEEVFVAVVGVRRLGR